MLLELQRSVGNRAVTTLLRAAATSDERPAASDQNPGTRVTADTSSLGREGHLKGHAADGTGPRQTGYAVPGVGSHYPGTPGYGMLTAGVTHEAKPTTYRWVPDSTFATKYDRPDAAGYAHPKYGLDFKGVEGDVVTYKTYTQTEIELAQSYRGTPSEPVLRDHEDGHAAIIHDTGRTVLAGHLRDSINLARATELDPSTVRSLKRSESTAVGLFRALEAERATAYDEADYPRMKEAYKGADWPIEELTRNKRLRKVYDAAFMLGSIEAMREDEREGHLRSFVKACDALKPKELHRAQYNDPFQRIVTLARKALDDFRSKPAAAPVREAVAEASTAIARFDWSPEA